MTDRPEPKSIAALTTARNAAGFVTKWIAHYGAALGAENLFVLLDGHDQEVPDGVGRANVLRLPHRPAGRAEGDRRRARIMSHLAHGLFHLYDVVIATDVDEFLVVDPDRGHDLRAYLSDLRHPPAAISALGLDVGQHLSKEAALDPARPYLDQRRYAHVSARYTKPVVATRPVTWGSGMHRVKGRNFHIDPNLYLFHFGMVDAGRAHETATDADRTAAGWANHQARRERLFRLITDAEPLDGDAFFPVARRRQTWRRPLFALNKPAMLPEEPVVIIPARFRGLV
jgi:hypothetical protein